MNHKDLVSTLSLIIQLLIIIVIPLFGALMPSIKAMIIAKTGKTTYDTAEATIKNIVHFVEQVYPLLAGDQKYIMVAKAINEKFGDKFTSTEVEQLVESAIKQMNIALGKVATAPIMQMATGLATLKIIDADPTAKAGVSDTQAV